MENSIGFFCCDQPLKIIEAGWIITVSLRIP